jgi:hypothetical protein
MIELPIRHSRNQDPSAPQIGKVGPQTLALELLTTKIQRQPRGILSDSVAPIAIVPMSVRALVIVAVHIVTAVVEAAAVEPGTEIAAAVIAVKASIISISWIISVGKRGVIARSVVHRDWNRKAKGKANAGTCRRFGEERQSSDRKNEDNELLHKIIRETN